VHILITTVSYSIGTKKNGILDKTRLGGAPNANDKHNSATLNTDIFLLQKGPQHQKIGKVPTV
jgi:hypothetical protein